SGCEDGTLGVWDLKRGRKLRTLRGHSRRVNGVAVSAAGNRAVSASKDKTLKVWDLESGGEIKTLTGHAGEVRGVALTADGKRVLSASEDKTLRVWELATGRTVATFCCEAAAYCCAWIDEHRMIAGDRGGRVYFLCLDE
ncbi:MAG: hypothetical protein JNK48_21825, partial [Bryobacterales bacterium]|nr:hypothetical protein [Bryobacterales bacterium]